MMTLVLTCLPVLPFAVGGLTWVSLAQFYPTLDSASLRSGAVMAGGVLALLLLCVLYRIFGWTFWLIVNAGIMWFLFSAMAWIVAVGLNGCLDRAAGHTVWATVMGRQVSPGYRGSNKIQVDLSLADDGPLTLNLGDVPMPLRDTLRDAQQGARVPVRIHDGWLHARWISAP